MIPVMVLRNKSNPERYLAFDKDAKLNILNSLGLTEYDCHGGVLHYCMVENKPENIEKLQQIGVPLDDIKSMVSNDGTEIDIAKFVFTYGEAEWFSNEEFLGYTP
ncbi:hypothetical protein ACHHV8_36530 [Paenibacillus sp. TAB 01]|uniref:hypothetical protein n=1 Tax=Paenibacillus sp. TAB 01 TaxID=3368988 RepID=UPI0037509B25